MHLKPVQSSMKPVFVHATRRCHVYIDFAAINFDICCVSEFMFLQRSVPHVEVRAKRCAD